MSEEHDGNENMGPKMAALSPLQRAWVYALVEQMGNGVRAAEIAGYGANSATREQREVAWRVASHSNSRNPKVQEAIREEAGHRLSTGALIGADVLVSIATDPMHKDRLKAAKLLLEHNGYQIIAQQEIKVEHKTPDHKEVVQRITDLATKLGLDPKMLLGRAAPVDAEFVVVQDMRVPASTAGLEDLL